MMVAQVKGNLMSQFSTVAKEEKGFSICLKARLRLYFLVHNHEPNSFPAVETEHASPARNVHQREGQPRVVVLQGK